MNKYFNSIAPLILLASLLFSVTSCDKEDDQEGPGDVEVSFSNKYACCAINHSDVHQNSNGRSFTIALSQYYISDLILVDHDGAEVPFTGQYLLVKSGTENKLQLSNVPAGHYHQIKFNVGVDSVANHADPSTYDAANPLAPQTPSMHWSWNSGYIFFRMEGLVDTTATKNGTLDFPYFYHLGTDAYLMPVVLDLDLEVGDSKDAAVKVNMDASTLLTNIDLGGADVGGHSISGNADLAGRFSTNIKSSFSVE
jgi:hypothetical protein